MQLWWIASPYSLAETRDGLLARVVWDDACDVTHITHMYHTYIPHIPHTVLEDVRPTEDGRSPTTAHLGAPIYVIYVIYVTYV